MQSPDPTEYKLIQDEFEGNKCFLKFEKIDFVSSVKLVTQSRWYYSIASTQYYVLGNTQPCWFHRQMQELILGIKWRKK